jgi:hypothetical protein
MEFVKSGIWRILQWFAKRAPSTQASALPGKGLPAWVCDGRQNLT